MREERVWNQYGAECSTDIFVRGILFEIKTKIISLRYIYTLTI